MIFQFFYISIETVNLFLLFCLPCFCILGGNGLSLACAVWMCWSGIFSQFILKHRLSGLECWNLILIIYLLFYPALFYSLGSQLSYLLTFDIKQFIFE